MRTGVSWHPLGVSRSIFRCDFGAIVMAPKEGCHGTNRGVPWHQRKGVIHHRRGVGVLTPRLPQTTPFFGIWHPFGTSFWVRDTRKTPELGAKVCQGDTKKGSIFDKVPTPEKGVRISISVPLRFSRLSATSSALSAWGDTPCTSVSKNGSPGPGHGAIFSWCTGHAGRRHPGAGEGCCIR